MFLILANNNTFAKLRIQPLNSVLHSNNLGLETKVYTVQGIAVTLLSLRMLSRQL